MSKEGSIEKGDGGDFIVPHNLFSHVECWMGEARGKALRKGFWLVWHATIWVIWCAWNDKVFNNITKGGRRVGRGSEGSLLDLESTSAENVFLHVL